MCYKYNPSEINEGDRISLIKTFEIMKVFDKSIDPSTAVSDVINDTIEEGNQSEEKDLDGFVFDVNSNENGQSGYFYYLVKVLNKGSVHSLANTQFKGNNFNRKHKN